MAGSLEAPFVRNAEYLLSAAGGLSIIPGVEHVSTLFAPAAPAAARAWLDDTFGPRPDAAAYTDRRILWYGVGLLGTLLVAAALAPLASPTHAPGRPLRRRLAALAGGTLGASLALRAAGAIGLELDRLLGLLVGGYLPVWFNVAGVMSLLLLRVRVARPVSKPAVSNLGWAPEVSVLGT